jgi:hypothetical protein
MLASLAWYYRDTNTVRRHRPQIEGVLSKMGLPADRVRHYWPLDGAATGAGDADADARFNPIEYVRKQLDSATQAQRQRDDALNQADK